MYFDAAKCFFEMLKSVNKISLRNVLCCSNSSKKASTCFPFDIYRVKSNLSLFLLIFHEEGDDVNVMSSNSSSIIALLLSSSIIVSKSNRSGWLRGLHFIKNRLYRDLCSMTDARDYCGPDEHDDRYGSF